MERMLLGSDYEDQHRRDERKDRYILRLETAINHVIANSPGTPDSVKRFLADAVNEAVANR